MDSTDVCRGVSWSDVDFEVSNAAQEVVLINIPLFIVTDIDIGGNDAQANEAGCSQDGRNFEGLVAVSD